VLVEADTVELGGSDELAVSLDGGGRPTVALGRGTAALAVRVGDSILLRVGRGTLGPAATLEARARASDGLVRVAGREYRGRVTLSVAGGAILAVNHLAIEEYLVGVVTAEMGRRAVGEEAALEAQAIASRTYALAALERGRGRPYDLRATVADQAYLGVERETEMGRAAVAATRGMVLTVGGLPIEAFFHSTCGGRTAAGGEVFQNGHRSYLRAVSDLGPDGASWCSVSPRFRWRETWTADQLRRVLQQSLTVYGVSPEQVTDVLDIVAASHTSSGRVAALRIRIPRRTVTVAGSNAVRAVLGPEPGSALRSAVFDLRVTRNAGRVTLVEADGRGAGHGVGLCQWGAVGRARAGQGAARILTAYFPGAVLERRW
jgi:stage II sporulation protein D